AAQPAKPAAEPAKPAAPAPQPAKPAAQAPKPAAQPAAPAKPASGEAKRILIGSTQSSSSQYPYWVAVGKVINDNVPTVQATVVETGATVENINRGQRGEFDVMLITTDAALQAYKGLDRWKDKPFTELRWLWLQRRTAVAIVVREDSGVKKLEDLNGKDFNPGIRGSATEKEVKDALEALGIKPKWYTAGGPDAVQAIKDKRIVGYGKTMAGVDAIDASILEIMVTTPIRVLGFTEDQGKKVQQAHPYYPFVSIPAGVFKDAEWNKQPVFTLGLAIGGGATTRLPEDMAYAIVKALDQDQMPSGKKVQATAQKAIEADFGKATAEGGVISEPPLHAGAIKWYKERGLKIPDALVPPEVKR
ncbi:MAG: TAXI family TRAP transporter solute-binding subunit, partial [Chloroflexi bacterium]|nr:TAXI family TRAP transporter solute-binding subunit [Chloroflexota bacterium]